MDAASRSASARVGTVRKSDVSPLISNTSFTCGRTAASHTVHRASGSA